MRIKKRHILLFLIGLLPFIKLIHLNDYCFGVSDLLIISGIAIVYIIAFLVIFFYNLYKISLKKELFNYITLIVLGSNSLLLFLGIMFHNKAITKEKKQLFVSKLINDKIHKIHLYNDATFDYKIETEIETCTKSGNYVVNKDTITLFYNNKNSLNKKTQNLIYSKNLKEIYTKDSISFYLH